MNPNLAGALRRAGIYFVVGYAGLTIINTSGMGPDNLWMAYVPLFITVYFFARWADAKIAAFSLGKDNNKSAD